MELAEEEKLGSDDSGDAVSDKFNDHQARHTQWAGESVGGDVQSKHRRGPRRS